MGDKIDMGETFERSYTHISLQFKNAENHDPWPRIYKGNADRAILLSVMEDDKVACEVDFAGKVNILNGRAPGDIIRLIALILSYQREEFFQNYNTKEDKS